MGISIKQIGTYIITVLIITSSTLNAQNQSEADSLIKVIDLGGHSDSALAKLYKKISIRHGNATEGLIYAKKFLAKAQAMGNRKLQAEAYEEINLKQRILGDKLKSFEAAFKALSIYEELDLTNRQIACFSQIGSNYILDEEYDKAIKYLSKSLSLIDATRDSFNTALTHINLGEAYRLKPDYDSAVFHFEKALAFNHHINNEIIEAYAMGNLGMVHTSQGDLRKGIEEMKNADTVLFDLGDLYSVSVYKSEIGKALIQLENFDLGEKYVLEGLNLAKQENLKEQIRDISGYLSEFYETTNAYDKSLLFQRQFQIYQDSLINKNNIQKIEQLKGQYELNKKESEIALLNQVNLTQRYVTYLLASGILLFIALAILLYKNNVQRRKTNEKLFIQKELTEKREEEKALLLKELNHRVKNNLQMISSLLNLQSQQLNDHPAIEAIKAGRYRVEAMSLIHQKLYQEDHHTQIAMKDYIEELVRNLIYSYNREIELDLNVDSLHIDIDYAIPLALIINELVTNALKYAYDGIENPVLKVNLYEEGEHLILEIVDNGVGSEYVKSEKNESFGLKLVNSLADQLDGDIKVYNGKGTHWHLSIAHKENNGTKA